MSGSPSPTTTNSSLHTTFQFSITPWRVSITDIHLLFTSLFYFPSPHGGSPSPKSVRTSPHFPFSILPAFVSRVPLPAWRAWETAAFVISFIVSHSQGTSLFPLSPSAFVSAAQRLAGVGIQRIVRTAVLYGTMVVRGLE